ncbi:hypothetical protein FOA52_005692 [Chlamydomonas sp. UWO 241]|nr:hypothetical protein FOA52_005692 [Chlamydomonas sp. UWO 241]
MRACSDRHPSAPQLFEALKSNGSLTILNLSDNQINDEGAQAIAVVLGMRGASGLLDLDLRDNAFTEVGLETLEGLKKVRKDVTIRTGSMHEPAPAAEAAGGSSPKGSDGVKDVAKGKMFRKFFQTGDDDDEALSLQESQLDDRGINPQELWTEIREAASGCGDEGIPALAAKLQQLCLLLSRETMAIQSPKSNALDGSKPHIKECVANLDVLRTCLDIVPRNVTAQYNGSPQPAVGTHRVGAAEAVMLLLGPNNGSLDSAVSKSKLASKVVHIAVSHPLCSNLHVRALKLFRSCLISPVAELGLALMQPGWGCDLKDPLVTPDLDRLFLVIIEEIPFGGG